MAFSMEIFPLVIFSQKTVLCFLQENSIFIPNSWWAEKSNKEFTGERREGKGSSAKDRRRKLTIGMFGFKTHGHLIIGSLLRPTTVSNEGFHLRSIGKINGECPCEINPTNVSCRFHQQIMPSTLALRLLKADYFLNLCCSFGAWRWVQKLGKILVVSNWRVAHKCRWNRSWATDDFCTCKSCF